MILLVVYEALEFASWRPALFVLWDSYQRIGTEDSVRITPYDGQEQSRCRTQYSEYECRMLSPLCTVRYSGQYRPWLPASPSVSMPTPAYFVPEWGPANSRWLGAKSLRCIAKSPSSSCLVGLLLFRASAYPAVLGAGNTVRDTHRESTVNRARVRAQQLSVPTPNLR